MSRIRKAYEAKFGALLRRAGARKPQKGLGWLLAKAQRIGGGERGRAAEALSLVHQDLLRRAERWSVNAWDCGSGQPPRFLCDVGLGALARWLRAAGYEAAWSSSITDDELIRQSASLRAVALTTDSLLFERRALRDGKVAALWVSPALTPLRQLGLVLGELRLPLLPARCMRCGGSLKLADKEALRERIPPRTYRWLDEFFLCERCGQLFWHGTHWRRIQERLAALRQP